MILKKIFSAAIYFFLVATLTAQSDLKILSMEGLEDPNNETLLYYGIDSYYSEYSWSVYGSTINRLHVASGQDTTFLWRISIINPYETYTEFYSDFDLWNNDPNRWIASGIVSGLDPSLSVKRFDSEYPDEIWIGFDLSKVFISNLSDSTVYCSAKNYLVTSNDSGKTWDGSAYLNFSLIGLTGSDLMFGYNENGNLVISTDAGNTQQIVDDNTFWNFDTELFYDSDQSHIYALANSEGNSYLAVSDNSGDPYTWQVVRQSSRRMRFAFDDSTSGELYYSKGNSIYKSEDYGISFNELIALDHRVTGLYKKPGSDKLYASTYFNIVEITADSVELLKSIIPTESIKYYPLQIGYKFVYTRKSCVIPEYDCNERYLTREVIGDTLMPNNKKYFAIIEDDENTDFEPVYYERIDTLTGKLFRYDEHADISCYEYVLDDFAAIPGDSFYTERFSFGLNPFIAEVTAEDDILFWEEETSVKSYSIMTGTFTSTYQYVREFGLSEVETWSDFLYMKDSLRGAVINGIVYGDTALVVSVNDDNEYLAKEFKLYQNYPNPFNPTTKIKYTIPTVERNAVSLKKNKRFGKSHYNVSLRVYSILGEEITTLVNEAKQPGTYEVEFDAAKLPSGVYFYRLNAGDYSETKKMILIR